MNAMDSTWNFTPESTGSSTSFPSGKLFQNGEEQSDTLLEFRPITHADMEKIWPFLTREHGRTTDFSYGGLLMWVDYFKYEYAIFRDTLFIKGVVEDNRSCPAFSLPVGSLPLEESVEILADYCRRNDMKLIFSAVPEYAVEDMRRLSPSSVKELSDWGDYLYEAESLAYLKGKKNSKKRNHVNQFLSAYPDWHMTALDATTLPTAHEFIMAFNKEGDNNPSAIAERGLTEKLIDIMGCGDRNLIGALLYADGKCCALTIGDIKGDTLYVHVEKALREYVGSYEMINKEFARMIVESHPEVKYINREDDAGDEGLRLAKQSYHPVEMLRKYNIAFSDFEKKL